MLNPRSSSTTETQPCSGARSPFPAAMCGRNASDAGEREVEGHHQHVFGGGAFEQTAARGDRGVGSKIEAVLPARLLEMERMDGGISQIEQMLAVVGDEDGEMSR